MKKCLITTILFIFMCTSFLSCDSKKSKPTTSSSDLDSKSLETNSKGLTKLTAIIKTVHGNIAFKFYPKKAPSTVVRIIELIRQGFYDGIVFHRVIPNFVIQGGDPSGTGMNGSGKSLKAEFNDLKHILGTVAMARSQNVDSADSQFYIALRAIPHLDNKYTIFGQVVEGFDILRKIQQGDKMISVALKN